MKQISALDKRKPYYVSTPDKLAGYAAWIPYIDGQK